MERKDKTMLRDRFVDCVTTVCLLHGQLLKKSRELPMSEEQLTIFERQCAQFEEAVDELEEARLEAGYNELTLGTEKELETAAFTLRETEEGELQIEVHDKDESHIQAQNWINAFFMDSSPARAPMFFFGHLISGYLAFTQGGAIL